jgi:putative DNA primase/helicase
MRRPDGNGGWINNTKGVDTNLLYRSDEVKEAIALGRRIAIVEGEKDADNLWAIGVPATCNAHGASEPDKKPKWTKKHSEQLRGASIVVLNDNDPPGRAHADVTCNLSVGVAERICRLDLAPHWPEIQEGGDVSDWLAAGHSREELDALIEKARDWTPQPESASRQPKGNGLEDTIALAFAEQHADDYRYVAASSHWMRWRTSCWRQERTLAAFDAARTLCRQARDARAKTVAAVERLAKTDRRIAATAEQFDANHDVFNMLEGKS